MTNQQQISVRQTGKSSLPDKIRQAAADPPISADRDNTGLLQAIAFIGHLLGVKAPSEAEKLVLLDYIRENMSDYTLAELRGAFKMAITGKYFDFEIKTYGQLSPQLFAQVMGHYRKYRHDILLTDQATKDKGEPVDLDTVYKQSLTRLAVKYRDDGVWALDAEANWDGKYDWLKANRMHRSISQQEAAEIKIKARQAWVRNLENGKASAKNMIEARKFNDILKTIAAGEQVKDEEKAISYQGKRLMVIRWLDDFLSGEVTVDGLTTEEAIERYKLNR